MIRAVIFDLDGVLVSTDRYHYKAWKVIADRLNIPFDEKVNNRLRGVSRMESLDIILEVGKTELDIKKKEELAEEKNGIYRNLLAQMSCDDVSDEVRETLKVLRDRGVLLAIGSSSKNTKYILEQVGLINEFDSISDGNNIKRSKPDPEVFVKAAKMLGTDPKETLVVEDAVSGIDAAAAGGFLSAGIGDAARYNRTVYPITRFSDLLEIQ